MASKITRFFTRLLRPAGPAAADDGIVPLRIPGLSVPLSMHVHPVGDAYISEQIRNAGIWEPEETRLLMSLLKPGQTFVDVGANIGYFTVLGSALVGPGGRVFAFEPDPDNFRLLVKNCEANKLGNAQLEEVALSDREGVGTLHLSEDNLGDHTIYGDGVQQRRTREIRLVQGNAFFADAYTGIDVIKVDVQGAEYQVLRGMQDALRQALPELTLVLEFSPNSLKASGSDGEELLALLLDLGLHLYIFDHRHHALLLCEAGDIAKWVRLTQMDASSEGFINLVCSGTLLRPQHGIEINNNEGRRYDPLEYLLASHLQPWDGHPCGIKQMGEYLFLSQGWSFPEDWGVWSDGDVSVIKFYPLAPAAETEFLELCFEGQYYGPLEHTRVVVGDVELGDFDLTSCRVRLPAELLRARDVRIVLHHVAPLCPGDQEGSDDPRRLKYGLKSLAWCASRPLTTDGT
jgi:FkbM family methyltransferase